MAALALEEAFMTYLSKIYYALIDSEKIRRRYKICSK